MTGPQFHLSGHARLQMGRRRVTEEDVSQALAKQIGSPVPGQPGSLWIRGYAVGGRILKVCVEAADRTQVITVAWPDEFG